MVMSELIFAQPCVSSDIILISDARLFFQPGKNRDGYFASEDLLAQVSNAVDIFELKTSGFVTGLFMFDNAPSHQKRAPNALSARHMVKAPTKDWTPHKGGPWMRDGTFSDGRKQPFYFPNNHPEMPGWFKGMELIIRERGLWPEGGLNAQYKGFKCEPDQTNCCCRRLLFNQPDFIAQKSQLEEYITQRGHLCDFYPKFHPELNFIEQYWGASKFDYRTTQKTNNITEMQENVKSCLDRVPLIKIRR
jgi:hypothetical protein